MRFHLKKKNKLPTFVSATSSKQPTKFPHLKLSTIRIIWRYIAQDNFWILYSIAQRFEKNAGTCSKNAFNSEISYFNKNVEESIFNQNKCYFSNKSTPCFHIYFFFTAKSIFWIFLCCLNEVTPGFTQIYPTLVKIKKAEDDIS